MNDNKSYFLYFLLCPISNDIKYVGITYQKLEDRLNQHLKNSSRKKNTHKNFWLNKIQKEKQIPQIKMLMENLDKDQARSFEIWWGGFLWLLLGDKLTNDLLALGNIPPKIKMFGDDNPMKNSQTVQKMINTRWTDEKINYFIENHPLKDERVLEKAKKNRWTKEKIEIHRENMIKNNPMRDEKIYEKHQKIIEQRKKKIYQYDLNKKLIKIWNCANDVKNEFENNGITISKSSLSRCCNGKNKSNIYKGFVWSYKEVDNETK